MTMISIDGYPHCTTNSITCEENKRKFEIIQTSQIERRQLLKIKIDGCIYNDKDTITRCDYIFELKDVFSCFIELKGTDINHAVKQLTSTLERIQATGKKHAFIVASKNDLPIAKTDRQKWELMFKKKFQARFDMKNNLMQKTIEELK